MTDAPQESGKTARPMPVVVPRDALLPPPAPGVRHVPIVFVGIVVADDDLRDRVARRFHWPMIVLALAILPLLAIEVISAPQGWMRRAVAIGFAVIWVAFVLEFVVKVLIAECRLEYVKRNWLDVVIIALPVLRVLRAKGAIVRTARVFKLRGVGMKFARHVFTIVVGLEATERMLKRLGLKADGRPDPNRMTRYQLIDEVRRLRQRNDAWDDWYDRHEAFVQENGGPCYLGARPAPEEEDLQSPPPCESPLPRSTPSSAT